MLRIHSYESMGTHDGPGLRLVVFVQGCRFNCLYCANPDTISTVGGTETSIDYIVDMAVRQKAFFGKRGGVTVSGGEPTLQAKELTHLFKKLKENGINTCLDTNGNNMNEDVRNLLEYTDTVLLDVKHMDNAQHIYITGRENTNTLRFADYLKEKGIKTWLRYVLVPGLSDQKDSLIALGEYFKNFDNIEKLEILPYHTLGKHKYEFMKKDYKLENTPNNTEAQLEYTKKLLEPYFKYVQVN